MDGLSSDHVTISLDEPAQVLGSNEIRADLENLTLSDGVRNMSPSLLGMDGLSVVEYEYVNPRDTELLLSVDQVNVEERSTLAPRSAVMLLTDTQVDTPIPAHRSFDKPTLKPTSAWNDEVKVFCKPNNTH